MILMNCELEKIGGKMYQFFPLQSSITPNHIQIDTKAVIDSLQSQVSEMKLQI